MSEEYFKLPRIFTTEDLKIGETVALDDKQSHYLKNVMRKKEGDTIRLFNGRDGECLCCLTKLAKKQAEVSVDSLLKPQPQNTRKIHLIFTPIKKNRMDWLIEKAVELGVTDFHPVLTQNTEVRKIKVERLENQIFEAAEQCERLTIPKLHTLQKMEKILDNGLESTKILGCLERYNTMPLKDLKLDWAKDIAFLIGPEGGFTREEKEHVAQHTQAVGLGDTILRCETAVVKALSLINP